MIISDCEQQKEKTMSKINCNELSAIWQMLFEKIATRESFKSGFVKRRSKMTGKLFAQTMVFGCFERPDASLIDFVNVSADLGVSITAPGLDQRINEKAVIMLQDLLREVVDQCRGRQGAVQEVFRPFQAVHILDSTHISLPDALQSWYQGLGGKGPIAGAKLQLSYEYLSGELSALELVDGRKPDQKCQFHCQLAEPGSLHLFDLGYFVQEVFATLDQNGAYFLSRLHTQAGLYWNPEDSQSFDLLAYLESLEENQHEFRALLGSRVRLPVRVLVQRLSPDVAAARRCKAKKKRRRAGKTASSRLVSLQDWQIYITNVPQSWLTMEQVSFVYRVRWQIELIFKLWKSKAKLATLGPWREERVRCQLYARLIALLLFHRLIAPIRFSSDFELSPTKAFRVMRRHTRKIILIMADGWEKLPSAFQRMEVDFQRFAAKDKRRKNPSTFQLLCMVQA
jgi:hypothetical protein